ncbi:hypothetical protein OIU79_014234 [Salix purpurea]|uniref:Uncharacterized protein n=1 Tax=Salix purpurea TaxID=77065 RepID=A0A9Q0PR25_SALPP|nr:hypothetical protein OIU79_014234 [Salix purpurea]KAJ6692444.1 hypothetical protein OIU79_014234 [Salix purpurea]
MHLILIKCGTLVLWFSLFHICRVAEEVCYFNIFLKHTLIPNSLSVIISR